MSVVYGRACGVVVVCLAFLGSSARAGFTTINGPHPGEKSIKEILDHVYGGSFLPSGVDYSNGPLTAVRIQDTSEDELRSPPPLNLIYDDTLSASAFATDQIWSADSVDAEAQARFALFSQFFGYALDTTSPFVYENLMSVNGSGFDQNGIASLDDMSNTTWRWARDGFNGIFTSQNLDNPDGVDHMITYRIDQSPNSSGGGEVTTYLLFFEDKRVDQNSDFDFNDMVVEIRATSIVPEPASLGLLALGGLLGLRRTRRRV